MSITAVVTMRLSLSLQPPLPQCSCNHCNVLPGLTSRAAKWPGLETRPVYTENRCKMEFRLIECCKIYLLRRIQNKQNLRLRLLNGNILMRTRKRKTIRHFACSIYTIWHLLYN